MCCYKRRRMEEHCICADQMKNVEHVRYDISLDEIDVSLKQQDQTLDPCVFLPVKHCKMIRLVQKSKLNILQSASPLSPAPTNLARIAAIQGNYTESTREQVVEHPTNMRICWTHGVPRTQVEMQERADGMANR